jgi:hypothetical protein
MYMEGKICGSTKAKYVGVCIIFCHVHVKVDTNTKKEENDQCIIHTLFEQRNCIHAVSSSAKCIKAAIHSKPENTLCVIKSNTVIANHEQSLIEIT